MQFRAIVSFSGKLSMAMGEVRDISDSSLADDLQRAGYIIPLETKTPKAEEVKAEKPKSKRKGKNDGN